MQQLENKVALVTGGTRSIGQTIVETLADAGAAVVFTGRSGDAGRTVETECRQRGLRVTFAQGSAADEDDVKAAVDLAVSTYGSLTTVVNNAAATHLTGPGRPDTRVTEIENEVLDEIIKVGLYGTLWACKHAIPHLAAAGGGAIVNITAASSLLAIEGRPAYQASKGAINALTRQVAVDYGRDNIRSNAIVVGFTNTGGPEITAMIANPAFMSTVQRTITMPTIASSIDIANAAAFLASDAARYITGVLLPVDAGLTVRLGVPDTSAAAALGD